MLVYVFLFLLVRRPPTSTRTDTLFPYTTLFRSCFETEALMNTAGFVLPVLTYLFHRLEERFNGRPTLLILDEAWVFLDNPLFAARIREWRSEEHTSELQSLMRNSYAVFCLKKKNINRKSNHNQFEII